MSIFNYKNSGIKNGKLYETHYKNVRTRDFPYPEEQIFLDELEIMNIEKIGTDNDLNQILENGVITPPFNLIWDIATFEFGRIPTYKEFVNAYLKAYCEKASNGEYQFKPAYVSRKFTFTYKALAVRCYKIYFSFAREYHSVIFFRNKGLNAFIDRRDDYIERMDVGIIYNKILYIIDTSLDSERSNAFEIKKETIRRKKGESKSPEERLYASSDRLKQKYNCKYYVRIPLKAVRDPANENFNIKYVGKFYIYDETILNFIYFYIKNIEINEDKILTSNYIMKYINEKEETKKYF